MISTITWNGRALVPLWVLQFIIYILVIIFLALALTPRVNGYANVSALTLAELVFFVIFLLMVIGEIIAYTRKRLNVWAFFTLQLFKTFFWTAIVAITAVDLCTLSYSDRKVLGGWVTIMIVYLIVGSIVIYTAFTYSCVQVHRHRKGKKLLNLNGSAKSVV